jgi:hypothetical protein
MGHDDPMDRDDSSLEEGNSKPAEEFYAPEIEPYLLSNSFFRLNMDVLLSAITNTLFFGFEMAIGFYLVGNASAIDICVFACVVTVCGAAISVAHSGDRIYKGELKLDLWLIAAIGLTHCTSNMIVLVAMMQQVHYSMLSPLVISNALINGSLYVADNKLRRYFLSLPLTFAICFAAYACTTELPVDLHLSVAMAFSVALHARCFCACIPIIDWVPAHFIHLGPTGSSGTDAETLATEKEVVK